MRASPSGLRCASPNLSTIAVPAQSGTAKYYNECLMKKEIAAHNLAEERKVIVQTRMDLHPEPATGALLAAPDKVIWTAGARLK